MSIISFGSLNIDHVYKVNRIVMPGETVSSASIEVFTGGKGFNQAVASAKAGAETFMVGQIGPDGNQLMKELEKYQIDSTYVKAIKEPSGHAIIQIDAMGQNSIIIYGGANMCIPSNFIRKVLANFKKKDYLLLQNETNVTDEMINQAHNKGLNVVFNPSPITTILQKVDFNKINYLVINELEGYEITKFQNPQQILNALNNKYPACNVILTLGSNGSYFSNRKTRIFQESEKVNVVDTTAAGDTFVGYFITSIEKGFSPKDSLALATKAAAIAIGRKGASPSIPSWKEIAAKKRILQ